MAKGYDNLFLVFRVHLIICNKPFLNVLIEITLFDLIIILKPNLCYLSLKTRRDIHLVILEGMVLLKPVQTWNQEPHCVVRVLGPKALYLTLNKKNEKVILR